MQYRAIVADPPWEPDDKIGKRGAADKYDLLTVGALCDLPVADAAMDDAALFMWFLGSMTDEALRVMTSWGFRQTQIWTWDKRRASGKRHFGMGRLGRGATEHLLVGVRGKIYSHVMAKNLRTIFEAQVPTDSKGRIIHSAKPEELQNRVERLLPGPYLEVFARRQRPGWTCLGNECPGDGQDVRESIPALVSA